MKFIFSFVLSFGVHGFFFAVNPGLQADSPGGIERTVSALCIGYGLVHGIHYATRKDY